MGFREPVTNQAIPMSAENCTLQCWQQRLCGYCKRPMAPRGRDVSAAASGGFCQCEQSQYAEYNPRHLWSQDEAGR